MDTGFFMRNGFVSLVRGLLMISILCCDDIALVSDVDLRRFLYRRVEQVFSSDRWCVAREGYFVVVEIEDDIYLDFPMLGKQGLLSDTFGVASLNDVDFGSPFEMVSRHPLFGFYEAFLLCNDAMGVTFIIPDAVVALHADLKLLLMDLLVPFAGDISLLSAEGC